MMRDEHHRPQTWANSSRGWIEVAIGAKCTDDNRQLVDHPTSTSRISTRTPHDPNRWSRLHRPWIGYSKIVIGRPIVGYKPLPLRSRSSSPGIGEIREGV